MKILSIMALLGLLLASGPAQAGGLDCVNPPFGKNVKEIEGLVKYREADGVEYYNYTGPNPCHLPVLEFSNPAIAYAAVNGKLYAQIESTRIPKKYVKDAKQKLDNYFAGRAKEEELAPLWRRVQQRINTSVSPQIKMRKNKVYEIIWMLENRNLRVKLKLNLEAGNAKFNYYYLPIWKELQKK